MTLNRRTFLGTAAAVSATLATPMIARAQMAPKVVVVGGGAGGATAAKYIARDSEGAIDVTLIEPTRSYYTCFFSNLYIGGFYEFDDLGHTYGTSPRPTASTWCMTGPPAWIATPRPCARRWRIGAL
jgi:sulfide dehydrogenase [flavocytochrome c] flavoprotein subunit